MPVHDWSRVESGVFYAFHHSWIEEISRVLNRGILSASYYALPEQVAIGFGPDVLALEMRDEDRPQGERPADEGNGSVALLDAPPQVRLTAEAEMDYYRRKQSHIAVRHASGDALVAVVEIVSPGNKSSRGTLRTFIEKAVEFIEHRIHLLIVDLHPPTLRDPEGIHGVLWEEFTGREYQAPAGEPLTLAAYQSGDMVRAYVEPVRVGDALKPMPLYLEPGGYVLVPLDDTYSAAFEAQPRRWQGVLEERG